MGLESDAGGAGSQPAGPLGPQRGLFQRLLLRAHAHNHLPAASDRAQLQDLRRLVSADVRGGYMQGSMTTCACVAGGELFSQRHNENVISLSVTKSGLELRISSTARSYETILPGHLLDNRWHQVLLEHRLGNLTLSLDTQTQVGQPPFGLSPLNSNLNLIGVVGTNLIQDTDNTKLKSKYTLHNNL